MSDHEPPDGVPIVHDVDAAELHRLQREDCGDHRRKVLGWLANWIVPGLGGEIRVGDPDGTAVSILLHAAAPRADETTAPTPSAIGLDD